MTLDLKIASGTSDLKFQVWRAVRVGISSLNCCQTSDPRAHESKIQDPRFSKNFTWIQDPRFWKLVLENLGSSNPMCIQDFCPGSKKSFLKILDLGFLTLTLSDLRFSTLKKPFQTWDPQVTETGVKAKHNAWTSGKNIIYKVLFLSFVALSMFCCNAHPHPLRVAAVSSARHSIILILVVHHPGRCLFFGFEHPLRKLLKTKEKYKTDSQD